MRQTIHGSLNRARERYRRLERRARLWRLASLGLAVAFSLVFTGFARLSLEDQARAQARVQLVSLGTGIAGVAEPAVPGAGQADFDEAEPDAAGGSEVGGAVEAVANTDSATAFPEPAAARRAMPSPTEGEASFYAESLEGRRTASGARYRGRALTAAHRTLPFGSRVKVTNLGNRRSVVVVVNDRGPFHPRRAIDLSRAAAERLRMLDAGRARVRMELLPGIG